MDIHTGKAALQLLGDILLEKNQSIEINLYGGGVFMLLFETRENTEDLDVTLQADIEIAPMVQIVADILHLPNDWLNTRISAFTLKAETKEMLRPLPPETFFHPAIQINYPAPGYLLAMKCMASRHTKDYADIAAIAKGIGLKNGNEVETVATLYYPSLAHHPRFQSAKSTITNQINLTLAPEPHKQHLYEPKFPCNTSEGSGIER